MQSRSVARELALLMLGQISDRQITSQIGQHIQLHHRHRRRRFRMRREERAELRLPARALGEHHQPLGHTQRHFSAVIPGQQVQRQINPGGDPGRGVERTVLDVQAIGLDLGRWAQLCQGFGIVPVGGDGAALENPCLPQDENRRAGRRSLSPAQVVFLHQLAQLADVVVPEPGNELATAWARFVATGGRAPVTDHAGRCVFEPAKTLTGEKPVEHCDQRHHHMPFAEHPPAMSGRIVAPVSELRADGHQAPYDMPARPQARRTAAKAVADHINGLPRKFALCTLEHRLEIQCSPIGP